MNNILRGQIQNDSIVTKETMTFNYSNSVVKTELFQKGQLILATWLQQRTNLFENRSYFNNVIQCLLSTSKIMNFLDH